MSWDSDIAGPGARRDRRLRESRRASGVAQPLAKMNEPRTTRISRKERVMKLIGSIASPYVRKVRIVMAEKKLDYDFVTEDVWSADSTISQSNPLGKVPCLVMEGGEALFDSRVIVEYLDTLSPVGKLIPVVGRERAEVKTWEA